MKVYDKLVIDIKSNEVIEEHSFYYDGPVSYCGSSGGGGGGGGSGKIAYPDYMEEVHKNWMIGDNIGFSGAEISQEDSLTSIISNALSNSPYSDKSAYDPETEISNMDSAVSEFINNINEMYSREDLPDFASSLEKVSVGKTDINACLNQSFDDVYDKAVTTVGNVETRLKNNLQSKILSAKSSAEHNLAGLRSDVERHKIIARKEETDTNRKIDQKDALWPLQIFQHGSNIMASISGGTEEKDSQEGPSDAQTAMAGASAGASAGYLIGAEIGSIGGPWGAAIGAVVGAGAALLA